MTFMLPAAFSSLQVAIVVPSIQLGRQLESELRVAFGEHAALYVTRDNKQAAAGFQFLILTPEKATDLRSNSSLGR